MNISDKAAHPRYCRQTMLPGWSVQRQERLLRSTALVVGLGGLGSAVVAYLAGAGVGHLILADPDTVSVTNLQRQVLYTQSDLGLPKTLCAARRVAEMNPHVGVTTVADGLTADNAAELTARADIAVDCTDNFAARYLLDDACAASGTPWVHGSLGEMSGQVCAFNLGAGLRYADLYPDRAELCRQGRAEAGVIGPVAGAVGSLQAVEVLKILAGGYPSAEGKLLLLDLAVPTLSVADIL